MYIVVNNNQSTVDLMKSYKPYILVLIVLLITAGVAYFVFRNFNNRDGIEAVSGKVLERVVSTTTYPTGYVAKNIAIPASPPDGYIKYENKKYGFSYYRSPQATIKEFDEGGGAMTIVQENIKNVRGLQIFIIPYKEKTISEERFRLDVPSGVRKNVEKTFIGLPQVEAVTFNSYDEFLGETREVWFIYNGHLYEITTFKGVGDWFAPLLQTWRFLN